MKSPLRDARDRVRARIRQVVEPARALVAQPPPAPLAKGEEPPVVARLVVEIRSDGRRTIARGAIEDTATQEQVAISAEGTTPGQLAASLAKSMFTLPLMAVQAARGAAASRAAGQALPRQRAETPTKSGAVDTQGVERPSDDD